MLDLSLLIYFDIYRNKLYAYKIELSMAKHSMYSSKHLRDHWPEQTCVLGIDTAHMFVYTWDNLGNIRSAIWDNVFG